MEENHILQSECEELRRALESNVDSDSTEVITPSTRTRFDTSERKSTSTLKVKSSERKNLISEEELDELHQQNADLQANLSVLSQEKHHLEKVNVKQAKELEQELTELRKQLDQSNKKIEDLEDRNFELVHKQKSIHHTIKPMKAAEGAKEEYESVTTLAMEAFNLKPTLPRFDSFIDPNVSAPVTPSNHDLLERIQKLESQSRQLENEKKELEVHIASLLEELNRLNRHCYELEEANSRIGFYENLFGKNNTKVVDLTDGSDINKSVSSGTGLFFNFLNSARSSVSSFAMEAPYLASPAATLRHRNPASHNRNYSASSAGQTPSGKGRTLWKEIENGMGMGEGYFSNKSSISGLGDPSNEALYNWIQSSSQSRISLSGMPEAPNNLSPTQYQFPPLVESPINHDDSVSVAGGDPSSSTSLHKKMNMKRPRRPRGVINIFQNFIVYIWTWFKYTIILVTAVGVALYNGPEHEDRDYY
jgi:predicted nuclease with TOPRIM domain